MEFSIDTFRCPHIYASIYCDIIIKFIRWLFGYLVTTCILITPSLTCGMELHNWPSFKSMEAVEENARECQESYRFSKPTFGFREPLSRSAVEVAIVDLKEHLEPNPKFAIEIGHRQQIKEKNRRKPSWI